MTEVETKYAIVRDGMVENVCLWDGTTPWTPPEGTEAVLTDGTVGPGWSYDGDTFTSPEPVARATSLKSASVIRTPVKKVSSPKKVPKGKRTFR